MSKFAVSFLVLGLLAVAIDISLPINEQAASSLLKYATGLFFTLAFIASVFRRRIKFDPVLR